jgi:hypothetical protein
VTSTSAELFSSFVSPGTIATMEKEPPLPFLPFALNSGMPMTTSWPAAMSPIGHAYVARPAFSQPFGVT